jgi:shikimate dehydrogenase
MHNAAFAADGLGFVYICLDVDPDDLPAELEGAAAPKLRVFNITMPHKRTIFPLLDELWPLAKQGILWWVWPCCAAAGS